MRFRPILLAATAMLGATSAFAANWVDVYEDQDAFARVDKDSIRRGSDGLVYFTSDGADRADEAADCAGRTTYLLKLYTMGGLDYPRWRQDGRAVVPGSIGDAIFKYACANAP